MAVRWAALALLTMATAAADELKVDFQWGVRIPLRDGVHLSANLYKPQGRHDPAPCIFTLTPYVAQTYHDRGVYFAAHGYPFLTVDIRGRGNSQGYTEPLIQEARDGYDVVEWLAAQPYCNGKVAMWGGSYAGYDQWATAKELPPHLATIVPAAAAYAGVDFPMRTNIFEPYDIQWLMFTGGHTLQERIYADQPFWKEKFRQWRASGAPLSDFDRMVGFPSPLFQRWLQHPYPDAYWDEYNPTAEQYRRLSLPILTITGSYDANQPGALTHYRRYMESASPQARARHFLVIGPWDHAGTRTPKAEFGGLKFGPSSLVDLPQLHLDWYAWTLQGGSKPQFLQKRVAYYVMGAEKWRYADTLEGVTARAQPLFLDSVVNATDLFAAGALSEQLPTGKPDHYVYDPRDLSLVASEVASDPDDLTDQRLVHERRGKLLVYHTAPFDEATEVSGFFKLRAWLGIDQPDTDFVVTIAEIRADGSSIRLTSDWLRARYRDSLRTPKLISTRDPLPYEFDHFTFVSRRIERGSRLRLTLAPNDSIFTEKNYNAAADVSKESIKDARPVTVVLYHDRSHPSALYVPLGQPEPTSK